MWDSIVSVPDHCLSFYFNCPYPKLEIYHKSQQFSLLRTLSHFVFLYVYRIKLISLDVI